MGLWQKIITGTFLAGALSGQAQAQEVKQDQPSAKERIEMMQEKIAHTQDSILAQAPEASVAEFRTFAKNLVDNEVKAGRSKYSEVMSGYEATVNLSPTCTMNYYQYIEGGVHSKGGDYTLYIGKPGKDGAPENLEVYNVDNKGVYKEIDLNGSAIYLPPQAQKKVLDYAMQQLKGYKKTHSIDLAQVAKTQKVND